jgi:hypothetical protein
MTDQIEELIKQVAAENGVGLSKDDPVMIMHTINARLLKDSEQSQQALLDQFKSEMEVIVFRLSIEAKSQSNSILNAAILSSRSEIEKVMTEQSRIIIEQWQKELNNGFGRVSDAIKSSRIAAILNVIASCITLVAALIILYVLSVI